MYLESGPNPGPLIAEHEVPTFHPLTRDEASHLELHVRETLRDGLDPSGQRIQIQIKPAIRFGW